MYIFSYSLFMNAIVYCAIPEDRRSIASNFRDGGTYGIYVDPNISNVKVSSNLVYDEDTNRYIPRQLLNNVDFNTAVNTDGEVYSVTVVPEESGYVAFAEFYNGDGSAVTINDNLEANRPYTLSIKNRTLVPDEEFSKYYFFPLSAEISGGRKADEKK